MEVLLICRFEIAFGSRVLYAGETCLVGTSGRDWKLSQGVGEFVNGV
ncbi:MAG: hypothetical protein ABSD98_01355 [Candidatus Korobacteraceae bacterium]